MKQSLKRKGLMLVVLAVLALGTTGCPIFIQQHPVHVKHQGQDGDRNDNSRSHDQRSHDQSNKDKSHGHDNKNN